MHHLTIEERQHKFKKLPTNHYLKIAIFNNYVTVSVRAKIHAMHRNIINAFPNPYRDFFKTEKFVNRAYNIVKKAHSLPSKNIYNYLFTFYPRAWAEGFITMKIRHQLLTEICYITPSTFQYERISQYLRRKHDQLLSKKATHISDFNAFIQAYCPEKWGNSYLTLKKGT